MEDVQLPWKNQAEAREYFIASDSLLCSQSLMEFVKGAWHIVEPAVDFSSNWHIEGIAMHLEAVSRGEIRNLLLNTPPAVMKSLLSCVFWPAWHWTWSPATRFMFFSYSQDFAVRDSVKCRSIVESDWYQERWGHLFSLTASQNQKMKWENTKTGFRQCAQVKAGTGAHPDILCVDDAAEVSDINSLIARQEVIDWWANVVPTRGMTRNCRQVVIGQRLHQGDLPGYILANETGWEHICLAMRHEKAAMPKATCLGWTDPRKEEGELLWPALFTDEKVKMLESKMPAFQIAGQLQQRPAPEGGGIFRQEYLRYYEVVPLGADDIAFRFDGPDGKASIVASSDCLWFQTCDTASKTGQEHDFTVVVTFALTQSNELLIYDVWRAKVEIPKQYGALIELRNKYPQCAFMAIEDTGHGSAIIQTGRQDGTPFLPYSHESKPKTERALAVAIAYQNGTVYHPRKSTWCSIMEDELLTFPAGMHDDIVDCISAAGRLLTGHNLRKYKRRRSVVLSPLEGDIPARMTLAQRLMGRMSDEEAQEETAKLAAGARLADRLGLTIDVERHDF